MLYNAEFAKTAVEGYMSQFSGEFELGQYSASIDGDINRIPVLDICRFFDDAGNRKYQDDMIRLGIIGKTVTIMLDGDTVGSFVMNNLTDPWEVFPVLNDHPLAHNTLNDIVLGSIAKKATRPRKKETSNVAAVKTK
jgi:hypothetical protein